MARVGALLIACTASACTTEPGKAPASLAPAVYVLSAPYQIARNGIRDSAAPGGVRVDTVFALSSRITTRADFTFDVVQSTLRTSGARRVVDTTELTGFFEVTPTRVAFRIPLLAVVGDPTMQRRDNDRVLVAQTALQQEHRLIRCSGSVQPAQCGAR
jgi:hypothetical protein